MTTTAVDVIGASVVTGPSEVVIWLGVAGTEARSDVALDMVKPALETESCLRWGIMLASVAC